VVRPQWTTNGPLLMDYLKHARKQRDNAPGTCNRKRASLRSYVRHLRLRGVQGAMAFPVEAIPPFCVPYQGQQFNLEPAEVIRLLDAFDVNSLHGKRDRVVTTLLYKSALRVGELAALDLEDLHLEGKEPCMTVHGKGRKERDMPLDDDMVTLLKQWLKIRDHYAGATRRSALFLSQKGNRLAVRTIQDNFKKLVDSLPPFSTNHVTPHALRHAFASHALIDDSSDRQLVLLKTYLGHALFKSTLIYARPSLKVLRQAVTEHVASEILADICDGCTRPHRERANSEGKSHSKRRYTGMKYMMRSRPPRAHVTGVPTGQGSMISSICRRDRWLVRLRMGGRSGTALHMGPRPIFLCRRIRRGICTPQGTVRSAWAHTG